MQSRRWSRWNVTFSIPLWMLGLAVLTAVPRSVARADGFIYVSDEVEVRRLPRPPHRPRLPRPHFPLRVTLHRVQAEVEETLAHTRIEERFHNPNPRQLEGTYIFPLPPGASVTQFAMKMGGKEVTGEILERDKARKIYEDIVRRVKDPGLLEYVDRGLFRARVFPIPANGSVDISIEYTESLTRSGGATTYRYPLDTGKYSAGSYQNVVIDLKLRSSTPLRSVQCPSHPGVAISRPKDREARVTFEAKELAADKDFVVHWNVSEDALAPFLLCHRGADERGFFFLSVLPRPEADKKVAKDVVFVIDTSGSMLGEKLEQVQRALRYCVHNLNAGDRFNIVDFSTEARRFRPSPVDATEENRKAAAVYIDALRARGGTNMEEGLRYALESVQTADRLQMVVLLTDGEPTIGVIEPKNILAEMKKSNPTARRVFVFGVGEDLNAKLLDAVAAESRGITEYISTGTDLEVPLARFYDKIDSPVLTDLTMEIRGGNVSDIYPKPLPDLFHGDQLDLFGRYDLAEDGAHRTVVLKGKFQGQPRVFEYSLPFKTASHDALPRLWATRKVGYLLAQMRLNGETPEVRQEVIRLSKRYGIITPYTSYLVVEEERILSSRPASGASRRYRFAARDAFTESLEAADRAGEDGVVELRAAFEEDKGKKSIEVSRGVSLLRKGRLSELQGQNQARSGKRPNGGVRMLQRHGRTFYLQGTRWIDAAVVDRNLTDTKNLRRVVYLSDDYFALLRKEEGIGRYLALGNEVTFLWKGKVVSVDLQPESPEPNDPGSGSVKPGAPQNG